MAAFKARETARIIKNPDPVFEAFLLYGPDDGLVSDRAKTLSQALVQATNPPGEILRIGERDLAEQPNLLQIEARTLPMFGGPKILRAVLTTKIKPDSIADLLSEPMPARLVLEAGNLKPSHKIRKIFETAKRAAALPCFSEGASDIQALIQEELTAHGFQVPPETEQLLMSLLGADYAVARNELQKLALYVDAKPQEGLRKAIDIADVEAIIGDSSAAGFDELIASVLGGQPKIAIRLFEQQLAQGNSCQTILILLNRHLTRLHQVQSQINQGMTPDQAMKSLRPPVFFKAQTGFKQQLRAWPLPALNAAHRLVRQAIKETRFKPELETELTTHTLLQLASRKTR